MNTMLWILTGVLAAAMLAAGLMKLLRPRRALVESGMGWAEDFSDSQVNAIATLEVAGALGLVLPALLDVAGFLVPLAALGIAALMIGAMVIHVRRQEYAMMAGPAAFAAVGLLVAASRWGSYPL